MPTKATRKTTSSAAAGKSKPASKGTPAVKKITARKPSDLKKAKEDADAVEKKKEESAKRKTMLESTPVSLIDEETGETKKAAPPKKAVKKVLPPISKIQGDEPKKEEPKSLLETVLPKLEEAPADEDEGTTEGNVIHLKPPITVRDLATRMSLKPFQLIQDLMAMEIFASINHTIEVDIVGKLCELHGFVFEREPRRAKGEGVHKPEPVVEPEPEPEPATEEELQPRAPIVTFMGHVDHGKTSLLDYIRESRVAAKEAGGITQHIGSYSVQKDGNTITFLDTPGHAAFTQMRARGANVTDIAVIVIAADDGIMPQTKEALSHAKAAGVKLMIAINKIDTKGANVDRVKQQLQEAGYTTEDWGGEVAACEVSAIKGTGIDSLLEMILLEAEMLELKASKIAHARGIVIEAQIEPGRGPTATLIVQTGTIKVGQAFLCGDHWGKVKSLVDDKGKTIKKAGPATPVKVVGFTGLPKAGDEYVAMDSERHARQLSEEKLEANRTEKLARPQRATLESLLENVGKEEVKKLSIILKGDVQGSVEALTQSLGEIESDKITLNILSAAVGPISESDILLASASDAIVVGFNVKVDGGAVKAAKREGVQVKLYSIIYELIDQIKEAMAGLLDPETRESVIGHAEIKQVFKLTKGTVAGCVITDGRVTRTARARVMRGHQPVYDGALSTLRRFQDEVKEVRAGVECGMKLGGFNDYQVKDVIECYILEKHEQKL